MGVLMDELVEQEARFRRRLKKMATHGALFGNPDAIKTILLRSEMDDPPADALTCTQCEGKGMISGPGWGSICTLCVDGKMVCMRCLRDKHRYAWAVGVIDGTALCPEHFFWGGQWAADETCENSDAT